MLVNASYHDHQEYIWFKGGHLDHFKVIFKLLVNASYYMGGDYDHFQDNFKIVQREGWG